MLCFCSSSHSFSFSSSSFFFFFFSRSPSLSSNLSGLSRYQTAVDAGLAGRDCSLLYSQCPLSYARAITNLL